MTNKKPKVLEIPPVEHYVDQLDRKRISKRKRSGGSRRRSSERRGGPRRGRAVGG